VSGGAGADAADIESASAQSGVPLDSQMFFMEEALGAAAKAMMPEAKPSPPKEKRAVTSGSAHMQACEKSAPLRGFFARLFGKRG
jgi:sulfur relay (sulfurtransferase) complex TusBCD TusD component (DsrE family)